MTMQSLAVELSANAGPLVAGLRKGHVELKTFEQTSTAALQRLDQGMGKGAASTAKLEKQIHQLQASQGKNLGDVGKAGLLLGAGIAGGLAIAGRATMTFEKEMSQVKAATGGGAAAMELLRDAAIETGKATMFSATEAAEAETALAKAGIRTADILGGALKGATDLAAAGQLAVGDAAEIAASAMTQFSLSGKDVPHIADLLAAGAGKAQGEVSDMAAALAQSGLVAASTGLSIEETTTALAAFASAGLLGSDAGTSLKTMLQRLTPQSDEAAAMMERLGIHAYDAQGKFVGLEAYAGNLQTALGGLNDESRNAAMGVLFGSDAVRAANVLYEQGAAGVRTWAKNVNDAGFAARTAATKMDNLSGDLEALGGSINTAFIDGTSSATGALRKLTQGATEAVNAYTALPRPVQTTVTAVGGLVGAASLAGGAFAVAVPKVAAFKASLDDMGPKGQRIGKGLLGLGGILSGPWGLALAGGVVALGIFGKAKADAAAEVAEFSRAVQADSGVIGENTRATAVSALEKRGLLKEADALGASLADVTAAALGDAGAMQRVTDATMLSAAAHADNLTLYAAYAGQGNEFLGHLRDVTESTEGGVAAARRQADALGATAEATGPAAAGQAALGASAEAASGKLDTETKSLAELIAEVQKSTGVLLGLRDANRSYEAAIDAAQQALKDNGKTLDVHSEKGRANSAALDAIAKSAGDVLQGMADTGKSTGALSKTLAEQRQVLEDTAVRFGMTREAARQYAASVLRIPPKAKTEVTAETKAAEAHLRDVKGMLDGISGRTAFATVNVAVNGVNNLAGVSAKLDRLGAATGGLIRGPGSGTSDSIPALLSNGEFVVNAKATKRNRGALVAMNSRRFAAGGLVTAGAPQPFSLASGAEVRQSV